MKEKRVFFCTHCGAQFAAWSGRCEECGKWNTLQEESSRANSVLSSPDKEVTAPLKAEPLSISLAELEEQRIKSQIREFDKVLGGGLVAGSLILLGGEPGIGKSTLILQLLNSLASSSLLKRILYISAEESREQVGLRAQRLNLKIREKIGFAAEVNLERILTLIAREKPQLVVIDSIQTIYSLDGGGSPGTISQVKLCADKLMVLAKEKQITIILIGHITKEGVIAGPKTLEHLVDVVLYLEGERLSNLRILRSTKNRFGPTGEAGIFKMEEGGFVEVKNPSEQFLATRSKRGAGSSVSCILEGKTPFLVEVQALTQPTVFGYPERKTSGFPLSRLNLLIAVIGRHLKIKLLKQDVYVNLVGGLKVDEPALDLAVVLAIVSAYKNQALPLDVVVMGEVGLSGEVHRIAELEKRIKEIERLEFKRVLGNFKDLKLKTSLELLPIESVEEGVGKVIQN